MRISEIDWDEATVSHIARHGVETDEVEETCFDGHPHILKTRLGRYIAFGQTGSGRYLAIVFEYLGHKRVKVITARAMSEAERKMFKRR